MLSCLDFILTSITDFMRMLFTIDVDRNLSLGLVLCLAFIFLPIMIRVINFIKQDAIEELNDRYDESRPRETWSSTEHQWYRSPGSTRDYGRIFHTNHTRSSSRRYKI